MAQRLGLYGGSFDPIHHGHLIIARAVRERLDLSQVIFLPAAAPPHKVGRRLANASDRAEMVKLAIADEPGFAFSDFDLGRAGPNYTIDTVGHFRRQLGPGVELCWIIGADSLAELSLWRRVGELVDACTIVAAARAGHEQIAWDALAGALSETQITKLRSGVVTTPVIEISSTDIRRRVAEGKSIRYLVPAAVAEYVARRRLYAGGSCSN
ncbi:MAG: nicotinate-nucleotide adenylyltransferase [Planctomycetota bacterium]